MKFDENSLYKQYPDLINLLIEKKIKSAKEYLKTKLGLCH
jgi:hypothetical protein